MNNSIQKYIVIAGAGMTGMMSALKLRKMYPHFPILIFDKSDQPGGMYGSISYKEGHIFDFGMHVIYESCNSEVDDLYLEILNREEWHIYPGNEKDIAGLFFNGKLQEYSHYVDLRSFPKEQQLQYFGGFFDNLGKNHQFNSIKAMDFLRSQFGEYISDKIHSKILFNLYHKEPEDINVFAIKATALERIILFDKEIMLDLMKSDILRSKIAFPDQINLPPYRTNTQKALYPKKFGMSYFFDRFTKLLKDLNIEILNGTSLKHLHRDKSRITQLELCDREGKTHDISVERLIWTAGWHSLAPSLNVNISDLKMDKGQRIVYINLVLDKPPVMGKLYYFYCYDKGFATFRVTNYSNYCPGAGGKGNYPVCVEFWPSRIGLDPDKTSEEQLIKAALDEIKHFGIIKDHQIIFSKAENIKSEFPMPSNLNFNNFRELRNRVAQENIINLIVSGVMAEDGLFFLPDILNDAFKKISTIRLD
ncbi:MAG: NAD(P)-binding protein [Deltaproteobacteria bacterium]|nr:NAD(P)-binding protein [Deltaproteobacteria bacterium]